MEMEVVLETLRVSDDSVTSCGEAVENLGRGEKGSENLGADILEDLDSYLEDVNDCLMISRMVSESVIKGMVNAVEQEAAEKIAAKELELSLLKESMQLLQMGVDKIESSEIRNYGYLSFTDACVEHDKMRESLGSLRNSAREQFKRLKKEIDGIRGCSSIRRISSGSELVGLGGILKEKETESRVDVDGTVDSLKTMVDATCIQVDVMLQLSKTSLCEWQKEQEFQGELEAMVMQSSIRSLQEEFEDKLWHQNAHFCGSQSVNWLEKFNEISKLRKDLDAILKLLPNPEIGPLISQGSGDVNPSQLKTLNNHISLSTSLWEGNGKVHESKTGIPETFDATQLQHMPKEDLMNYFNAKLMTIKRDHESTVQRMAEEYITLKGKYLKNERGSSLPFKKDKEFEVLRKKIPEVIWKLDDILVENETFPVFSDNANSLGSLSDRLNSLLLENHQLRDSLTDKKNEIKCLSSQISDAAELTLQHALDQENLIGNHNAAMEDARVVVSVTEEVYKCVLRELSCQIKCGNDKSEMELIIMQEIYGIIFREAVINAETTTSKCETEDSDMESIVMQGLWEIIFRETIKGIEQELKELCWEYSIANEYKDSLEMKALEKENELRFEVEEKERLKQEVLLLATLMEEKEKKLALEVSAALTKEREQLELASRELSNLKGHARWQRTLISENSKELVVVKGKLEEALEQIDVDEVEINSLNQKLELALGELKEADEQRKMVLALAQEKQNDLLLFEAKEKEYRMQMEAVIVFVNGLLNTLADFECRVADDIKTNNLRLEHSSSRLSSLIKKASALRKTGLLYKQRLERRCSDLQMAESEVDLLGDEVDALLSLLEKIYIALDHYSPILQHYPGIIEILKLVRRELSGESTKPV